MLLTILTNRLFQVYNLGGVMRAVMYPMYPALSRVVVRGGSMESGYLASTPVSASCPPRFVASAVTPCKGAGWGLKVERPSLTGRDSRHNRRSLAVSSRRLPGLVSCHDFVTPPDRIHTIQKGALPCYPFDVSGPLYSIL